VANPGFHLYEDAFDEMRATEGPNSTSIFVWTALQSNCAPGRAELHP